jgi:hypothetical protein
VGLLGALVVLLVLMATAEPLDAPTQPSIVPATASDPVIAQVEP